MGTTSSNPQLFSADSPGNAHLVVEYHEDVVTVIFNRTQKCNALTPEMYRDLRTVCRSVNSETNIRLLVLLGSGGAFTSGSDIGHFRNFTTAADAIEYERGLVSTIELLEGVRCPTMAVVDGACAGAGLVLASACDVRIATRHAYFTLPIARTVGNTLSAYPTVLLADRLGESRLMDLLTRAGTLTAAAALEQGFVSAVCDRADMPGFARSVATELVAIAPLTVWSMRQTLRRARLAALPETTDLVRTVYSSNDFQVGVEAFLRGDRGVWSGG